VLLLNRQHPRPSRTLRQRRARPPGHGAQRLNRRPDLILRNDASRTRKDNAAAITTAIPHLARDLPENEPSKLRLSRKRSKATWNGDYRATGLFVR
jgi:hypothetical protein